MFRRKKDTLTGRQFYVQFLGWLPSRGVQGSDYTASAIYELKARLKERSNLPKLTLKINDEDIEVSPIIDESKKKSSNQKIFNIKLEDLMFVSLECRESDVAACIYRNRKCNTQKSNFLQVHVYRFDSSITALHFVKNLQLMTSTESHMLHVRRIEDILRRERESIEPPIHQNTQLMTQLSSEGSSSNTLPEENTPIDYEDKKVQAITDELKKKFKLKEAPLLLPAKDYDTVRRKQGHLDKMGTRKCRTENVVGALGYNFDDEEDDDDDSKQQPPYPLYPVKRTASNLPISHLKLSPEIKHTGSPESVHLRDNKNRKPNSSYGSDSDVRNSTSPILAPTQNPIFGYDKTRVSQTESLHSTVSSGRSGSSNHSGHVKNILPTSPKPKPNLEIPPDYDDSPQTSSFEPQSNIPRHGYYKDDIQYYPRNMVYQQRAQHAGRPYSSNLNLYQNHSQPKFDPSELYSKRPPGNKKKR